MSLSEEASRLFNRTPWAAHLYVTDQCNLDCQYCNEYDNSVPHPRLEDLKEWMTKIRAPGVIRLGLQGGEPLLHPDIAEIVRYGKEDLGFSRLSIATNGFRLTKELLRELEQAGLDAMYVSVDRMTPIPSTRKSMKSIRHKLNWFVDSRVKLNVSGVLFQETAAEIVEVIDACTSQGIPVQARVVHDDLVNDRPLVESGSSSDLERVLEYQRQQKLAGRSIKTDWNIF